MAIETTDAVGNRVAAANRLLIVLPAILGLFIAAMDSTVVGTLLPYMKAELRDDAIFPWLISGFILTSIVATPAAGRLADAIGEKLAMLAALALFLVGSACVWQSSSMLTLVWSRALQGVGAGAVSVMTYVVIGRLYTDSERGRMQGMLSLVWGLAAVLGPVLGTIIQNIWGWRVIFLLNLPLCALIMALIAGFYPAHRYVSKVSVAFDPLTILTFAGLLGAVLLLIMAPSLQFEGRQVELWVGVLIVCLIVQWLRVRGKPERSLVPVVFLVHRRYLAPALLTLIASMTLYAAVTLLPLYMQRSGQSATLRGGVMVMVAALGWVIGAALCGSLLNKISFRRAAFGGATFLALGTAIFNLGPDGLNVIYAFALGQMFIGLGIGSVATSTLVLVQNQAPLSAIGSFTAAIHLCRNIGAAIGINLVGSLQIIAWRSMEAASSTDHAWNISFKPSFLALMGLSLLALVLATLVPVRAER